MPKMQATTIKPQSYSVFVYNSSGSQSGNRYNSWSNLMTAVSKQEGFKDIVFEQDETIPAGAWNLDYCNLRGNGNAYDNGGYTITWPTGVTISSWTFPRMDSVYMKSTSNAPIWTTTGAFVFFMDVQTYLGSTTAEFIKTTSGAQHVFYVGRGSHLVNAGYEVYNTTAAAYADIVVISRQQSSVVANNLFRGTNAVIFLDLVQHPAVDTSAWVSTHTNLTIGVDFSAKQNLLAANAVQTKTITDATSFTPVMGYEYDRQDNTQAIGNLTMNAPTGTKTNRDEITLVIKSTNVQTFIWNAVYRGSTTLPLPTTTTGGSKTDLFKFSWNATDSKWDYIRELKGF